MTENPNEPPTGGACLTRLVRPYDGPRVCQHCGYYAKVRRRTVNQGWHVAEWGECRKADITRTGVMTPENETCADFTPDPRRPDAA